MDGLRIADGSIIPELPSSNTMAPCYMNGGKAAEMIKTEWGGDEPVISDSRLTVITCIRHRS